MKRLLVFVATITVFGLLLGGMAPPKVAAAAEQTITIGFTASLTGRFNVEATRQINGINLWIEQVNKAGGIKLPNGTQVKVAARYYDDESSKDRVQQLYSRLINSDKANFLISPYSSGLADAAAVIAQQNNRIMITTGAASDSTYKKGFTLIYQAYTPASHYLTGALDILKKLDPKVSKMAIVYEKDKFASDVVNALKVYAEKHGVKVVVFEGYSSDTADFAPFIDQIPAGVDAIMGGGHFADGSTLARQIYEKKVKTRMIALMNAPAEPKFAELGQACISVITASQWEPEAKYSPEVAKKENLPWFGPTSQEFVKAYKAKYKEVPSYHSAGGYVTCLFLQKAIQDAGSLDTNEVKAALDKENMYTFYGRIKFDTTPQEHGLQIGHEMIVVQWQKGEGGKPVLNAVWPPAAANASPFLLTSP
ncbi:MAG: amino acid ABC transporter substrate-binding protein [Desulfobaccales bacterium]